MKRIISLLLVVLLTITLSACGDIADKITDTSKSESTIENGVSTSVPESKPESAKDENKQNDVSEESSETPVVSEDPEISEEPEVSDKEIEFSEITVIDNEDCTIKITGIDPDNMWGYTIKVYLENKSTDLTYMFSIESASVNGVQVNPFWASDVAAGKKAKDEIVINDSFLDDNNITEFTDIALNFRVYDYDDWMADDIANESIHIYPYGEDAVELFVRETLDTDNVIVDTDSTKVTVIGYEYDDIWGHSIKLYIENKTDKTLMYTTDETSVNGFMISSFFANSVAPGLNCFTDISLSSTELEENEIEAIEDIEFNFRIYDNNDWMADDYFDDVIVLTPTF